MDSLRGVDSVSIAPIKPSMGVSSLEQDGEFVTNAVFRIGSLELTLRVCNGSQARVMSKEHSRQHAHLSICLSFCECTLLLTGAPMHQEWASPPFRSRLLDRDLSTLELVDGAAKPSTWIIKSYFAILQGH